MSASTVVLLWIAFFVLCPVLNVGGHFVYLPEIFIYIAFITRLLFSPSRNGTQTTSVAMPRTSIWAHVVYLVLFLAVALWTASLVDQSLNNYDVYVLRNILQVVLCLYLLSDKLRDIAEGQHLDKMLFRIILILCVPAVIVYLQRFDLFSMRSLMTDLYKPQFFFLDQKFFASFRYTSVFKDFFTAAVYFTMLASFMFYFTLRTTLSSVHRIVLTALLVMVYGAQLFVARSSLVAIPILISATALYAARLNVHYVVGRLAPTALFLVAAGFFGTQYLLETGLVNSKWATEAFAFVIESGKSKSDSVTVMQEWNESLYRQIERRDLLWQPHHAYNLNERKNPGLYTDSFYGQEIYRFGIYGLVAYGIYIALMLGANWRSNRYVFLLVLALGVLNIKGGNTFFMPKNIYLYALILAVTPLLEKRRSV